MRQKNQGRRRASLGLATLLFAGGSAFSLPSLAAEGADVIEEVIVTARKKDESIQDVPGAVSAITGQLKEQSVRRIEDIQAFAPNLFINRTPGIASGAAITIRGVASLESDKSFDPAIGVVMDGMFLGTSSGVLLDNFDIERIEVLRGPQGTLFGKNTTGGILNVIRTPVSMSEFGADLSFTGGQYGRQDVKAVVQLPLVENKLGLKLFGASIKHDGHVYNTTLQRDVGGDDKTNYGFAAKWAPTDSFDLKVHYEIMEDQSEQGAYTNRNSLTANPQSDLACLLNAIGLDLANGCQESANDGPDTTESDGSNFSDNDYKSTIITANFDSEDFLYTYIYTNRDMDEQNMQDFDGAPVHMLRMNFFNDWEQTSHEFRVTSQFSDRFQFIAGFYDWETNFDQRWDVYDLFYQLSRLGNPVWAAGRQGVPGYDDVAVWEDDVAGNNGQSQLTTSTALFFSADWYLTDQWTITAGFRWTEEEKDFVGGASAPGYYPLRGETWPGIYNPYEAQQKWTETTPKFDVRYQMNDDVMLYGSYSEGFKSGGFFARQANYLIDPSYDPEYVKNYEFGWKTTMLDGRMIFNGAIFRSDYDDKQESILIPISTANVATVVRNASSLEMEGVELEAMVRFNEAWDMMVTYGYLSAEYADYLADLTGSGEITDNSGLVPRNIPENTLGVTTSYTMQIGDGDLKARLSYRYRDNMETNSSNFPQGTLDSITNLNATLAYSWSNYQATLWGRNLTDEREERWGTIGAITTRGWWNEPATYGFTISASF